LAYPTDISAYSRLSNLLTLGNLRTEKGKCDLYKDDVVAHAKGCKFIVVPPPALNEMFEFNDDFKKSLQYYREVFGEQVYLAASRSYQGDDAKYLHRLSQLAIKFQVPMVATNDIHYHHLMRREL